MQSEELKEILDKSYEHYLSVAELAEKTFIAENARMKVGDVIKPYDSNEPYEIVDIYVADYFYENYDEDKDPFGIEEEKHTPDYDVCYSISLVRCRGCSANVWQKELLKKGIL